MSGNWIGCKSEVYNESSIYIFRKEVNLSKIDENYIVRVCADSRYKLYVNNQIVSIGPCKSVKDKIYYDTMDISPYLKIGKNVICAEVMHLSKIAIDGNLQMGASIIRGERLAFLLDGKDLDTDETWKVLKSSIKLMPGERSFFAPGNMIFNADYDILNCKSYNYDDSHWENAKIISPSYIDEGSLSEWGITSGWNLCQRPIPMPTYIYKGLLKESLYVESNSKMAFVLDANELTTGYVSIKIKSGKNSIIKLIYSECYEEYKDGRYTKGIRDDDSLEIRGDFDIVIPNGDEFECQTLWFRTFRYIKVEIETKENPLEVVEIYYHETNYPLFIEGNYESDGHYHNKMWEISLRTLKNCMHETYEDCPYYEQLQYTMDSRLQMLFNYQISKDVSLAKKCIDDFHCSATSQGMILASYPSTVVQVIPGFSLYWIYMLEDFLIYQGDKSFVKKYRATADRVLDWFDEKIDVKTGLVGRLGRWSYVDWVDTWYGGVPTAEKFGGLTIYNLMYAKALESAALINSQTGRYDCAKEYLLRRDNILKAVNQYCWDSENQLYTDAAGVLEFSQHTQIWAVLAGAVSGQTAKTIMKKTLDNKMPKASYSMSFMLFRALEMVGLYNETDNLLNEWRKMIDNHLTTWVEDNVGQRSDCHAWGSLPIFEFTNVILGVKPLEFGYEKIKIQPYIANQTYAKGSVCTPKGLVYVNWYIENDVFNLDVISPKGIEKEIVLPDGSIHFTNEEKFNLNCRIKKMY